MSFSGSQSTYHTLKMNFFCKKFVTTISIELDTPCGRLVVSYSRRRRAFCHLSKIFGNCVHNFPSWPISKGTGIFWVSKIQFLGDIVRHESCSSVQYSQDQRILCYCSIDTEINYFSNDIHFQSINIVKTVIKGVRCLNLHTDPFWESFATL